MPAESQMREKVDGEVETEAEELIERGKRKGG